METRVLALSFCVVLGGCASAKPAPELPPPPPAPAFAFEVTEGILHPESALYSDAHDAIFVSNIASGNPAETKRVGYLSKLAPDGKVIQSKWVKGLKAPKGIAIRGNELWVSDVNQIVKVDIEKGKIARTYDVKGAKFLNDVAIDSEGVVYVTDMASDTIYSVSPKGLAVWLKSPKLRGPNGITIDGDRVTITQWGTAMNPKTFETTAPGALTTISLKSPEDSLQEGVAPMGYLDGLATDSSGTIWVSDWMNGDVYRVDGGKATKVFNLGQGAADLSVAVPLKLLLIPQMNQNHVTAYRLP